MPGIYGVLATRLYVRSLTVAQMRTGVVFGSGEHIDALLGDRHGVCRLGCC